MKQDVEPEPRYHGDSSCPRRAGEQPSKIDPLSSPSALGQGTVSITLDTYSHAIPAMQEEEAAQRIAGLVFADE